MRVNPTDDTVHTLRAPVALNKDSFRQQLADERFARIRRNSIKRSIEVLNRRFPNGRKRLFIFRLREHKCPPKCPR